MSNLRELTTDVKRLYEAMNQLLEQQDEANTEDIDFRKIELSAKSRPFEHHCIDELDEDEARSYLLILSGLIALADNTEKKIMQFSFLARIIAGYKKAEISLKDIVTSGSLVQEKNIDELQKIENENEKIYLLIDLMLLVYLDGNIAERQLDYTVEIMTVLGIDRVKIKAVGNVVKGVLEQNDGLVFAQSVKIDITGVCCYMKNLRPDGVTVYDLEKAKSVKASKIIFEGLAWKGISRINIDEYKAEIVEFDNCTFQNIEGVTCFSKKVVFKDCKFTDCEVEENLFILKNAIISGTLFRNIKTCDSKCEYLFYLYKCEVTNSKFISININHNWKSPYGGFFNCKDCALINIVFQKIKTSSSGDRAYRKVIVIDGGKIMNCILEDCVLTNASYLLTIYKNTERGEITIKNLNSDYPEENTSYFGNSIDMSINEIFEVK